MTSQREAMSVDTAQVLLTGALMNVEGIEEGTAEWITPDMRTAARDAADAIRSLFAHLDTAELMADPEATADLREADAAYERGEYFTAEQVRAELDERIRREAGDQP